VAFTIELGWWIAPVVVTIATFGSAAFVSRDMGNDQYGAGAIVAFGFYMAAAVGSLISWLLWALLS